MWRPGLVIPLIQAACCLNPYSSDHALSALASAQQGGQQNATAASYVKGPYPPEDYQKVKRPSAKGPVSVNVNFELLNFHGVDDAEQTATMDILTTLSWVDRRLAWDVAKSGVLQRRVDPSSIWIPGLDIINQRNPYIVVKAGAMVKGDTGTVEVRRRILVTVTSSMDFTHFPFDNHMLTVDVESFYYTADDVIFTTDEEANKLAPGVSASKYIINAFGVTTVNPTVNTDETTSRVTARLSLSRLRGGIMSQIVLPLLLIVGMAFSQLWMHLDRFDVRIAVIGTAMLTVMAFSFNIFHSLPPISYLTWMHYFLLISLIYIFCCLVECTFVHFLDVSNKFVKMIPDIEAKCRFWYPFSYVVIVTVLFLAGGVASTKGM